MRVLCICSILSAVLLIIGCGVIINNKFDPSRTAEAERIINADPEYRKVDDVCKTIPLPVNSTFVGKARLFNSIGIIYFYSSQENLDKIESHFRATLTNKGWEPVPNDLISRAIGFRKDNVEISSQLGGISSDITFSLNCEKMQPKP
jgi:hypothetical protein